MPVLGHRNHPKRIARELVAEYKVLAATGDEKQRRHYKKVLAEQAEGHALQRARSGRERQLQRLVEIAVLMISDRLTAYAAAGKVADEIGGKPRDRRANQKTLYYKFKRAPEFYKSLAQLSGSLLSLATQDELRRLAWDLSLELAKKRAAERAPDPMGDEYQRRCLEEHARLGLSFFTGR